MKVLHILAELNPSGAETMLFAAGPLLKDFDICSEILSTGAGVGSYAGQLSSAGYTIHHIAFKKSPFFFWKVFKLLNNNAYDVIHLHTETASFWFGIVALLTGKRVVQTIHNNFPFTGYLGWVRKWQRQLLSAMGVAHVAISESVKKTELKHFNLTPTLIPNWYNSIRFKIITDQERSIARESLKISSDKFVLVSVGNCSEIKNHSMLIHALAKIQQGNTIYLHIGIEKDNKEQDLAEQLGIADKILFLGMQTDILPFLYAADLYVMPSMQEGCPISAIEAIASGLPVLFTDVPGLADFADIFQGLFYCIPTPESISLALAKIIDLGSIQLGKNCASNAQQAEYRFGIKRGLSAYMELYEN